MTYWRQNIDRKMSYTMDLRLRPILTLLMLLLSAISVRPDENEVKNTDSEIKPPEHLNADIITDFRHEFRNYSDFNFYDSSKRGFNDSYDLYGQSPVQSRSYGHNLHMMYGGHNYNYHYPTHLHGYNQSHASHAYLENMANLQSPYQNLPGTYNKMAYNEVLYFSGKKYNPRDIYASYLATGAYAYFSKRCSNHYGQTPQITTADLGSAFDYAYHNIRSYDQQYGNHSIYSSQSPPLKLKEKEAILMELVTEYFAKYKCLSKLQTTLFLPTLNIGQQYVRNRHGDTSCYSSYGSHGKPGWELKCPHFLSKFRTIDGSCNNLKHPYWGKSYVCHIRLLPPDYSDGVSAPRLSHNGHKLPNSRTLSNVITSDKPFDAFYTQMKMAFGQFVNHDITHTPVSSGYALSSSYGGSLDCCRNRHNKQCYPIDIEPSPYDHQYTQYKNTCMSFVRSAPCPLCEIGPRQQMNIATSFIDAGTVYGSTLNESVPLRTFQFGLLKTSQDIYGKPILLSTPHPWQNECSPATASMSCFLAGDGRCNQHPSLQAMHLVLLRRHNQHATSLRLVNPHWGDEILYQEARRVLIAEYQHITFNEYLPILFGPLLSRYFNLNPLEHGYTNYEPHTDPTSWNDYATSACRFGHSQVHGLHSVINRPGNFNKSESYWLKDRYFDPIYLWEGKIDGLLKGLIKDLSGSVDPYYTDDIKDYLLRKKGERFGSDLIARNIHRGREHGLPGYVNYLKYCFGFEARSWDDLRRFIPDHIVNLFKQLYNSYEDIDFYIAGISERHYPDADVGPTFACVLGIQYYHAKFGDRYYYEHGGQSGSFNLAQLDDIRRTSTIARLICRTGDYINRIQPYAFFPESKYNSKVFCKSLPELNYNLWKEN